MNKIVYVSIHQENITCRNENHLDD